MTASFCWVAASAAAAVSGAVLERVLREVDAHRMPAGGFEAVIVITPWKDGVAQEPGRYVVKSNGDGPVLVEAISHDQRGQKFLTTDSGIFFFAPRTRRAIRITPLQVLRGQASVGDIARLRFAADYEPGSTEDENCRPERCLPLLLTSKNESSTYARITLYVAHLRSGFSPRQANLFLASGRLAKKVIYEEGGEAKLPASATYVDAINVRQETTVVYESVRAARFHPSTFNPRFLEQ